MAEKMFCFMDNEEIKDVINNKKPKNTRKNTTWSISTWDKWAYSKNRARQMGQPPVPLAKDI